MTQRIRHRVVFLSFLASVLLYLDRFGFSYIERLMKVDLGFSEEQIGWGLSAFFWSYALAQVPSGILTERYGPRRMLTIYILLWSAFTAMMGWINGFAMLIAARLCIGLAQAGAYPTCAAIVGRWVPLKSRGTASGLVAVGGRIGGGIAPLLTAFLVTLFATLHHGLSGGSFADSDILDPAKIVKSLVAAQREPVGDLDEAAQARRDILRSTVETSRSMEMAWEPGFGLTRQSLPVPLDSLLTEELPATPQDVKAVLNGAIGGAWLAGPNVLRHLPVERAAVDAVMSNVSPKERPQYNRLILEAALPGLIRPFYAAGWRPVMWTYGLAGIVVAALFWFVVRDWPANHPRITAEELSEIQEGRSEPIGAAVQARPRLPLGAMTRSVSLWLISGSQFFGNIAWTFLVLQLPRYLQEAHHLSFADRSFYASIPLWCGWVGMFLGGIATDHCVRRMGLRAGRIVPLFGSRILATTAFVGLLFQPTLPIALALLSVVAFAADFASPATWAFNQDIGGRFIASTLGWGNMWGNIGSALSPLIIAETLKRTGSWSVAFALCATAFVLAGLCCLFIDPRKSIDTAA